MRKTYFGIAFFAVFLLFASASPIHASETIGEKLKGRILLQVEAQGEAWYVNPLDAKRHYLGRPDDAFRVMREQGLGISNGDIARIVPFDEHRVGASTFAKKFAGRILLQVQSHGEAWYVNPLDFNRYYLGRPDDAFILMRSFGLGISNSNLAKISQASANKETLPESVSDSPQHNSVIVRDTSGKHFAYVAKKGEGEAVVRDGVEQMPLALIFRDLYSQTPELIFSPNGERLMYGGRSLGDGRAVYIVDGKEILSTDEDVEAYGFSPDSRHTYIIQLANFVKIIDEGIHEFDTLYIDGKKYKTAFPALRMEKPQFSNGATVPVYWTGDPKAEKRTFVVGDIKQGEYPTGSGDVVFSPNGKHYALRSGGFFNSVQRAIVDGKQVGRDYKEIESLAFRSDGATISFIGIKDGKRFLVEDGKEQAISK